MYCKYCGKPVPDGETCSCRNQGNKEPVKMQPQVKQQIKPPVQMKPPKKHKGTGMVAASLICSILMVLLFVLLRFVFADDVHSFLMYAVPLIFGTAGLLLGIFAAANKSIRKVSIVAILVSALGIAAVFGTMVFFPYEQDTEQNFDEDEEDEEDDKVEEVDEKQQKVAEMDEVIEQYETGSLDYIQAKEELDELDMETFEGADAEKVLAFQEKLETDLEDQMEKLAEASDYKKVMETLRNMDDAADGEDEALTNLLEKYEPEYILYLDTESRKLAEAGQTEEAVRMLEEGKMLVEDSEAVTKLLLDIQNIMLGDDYIIADSNSRYLTEDDIKDLSIQQLNYAKNEIYARHGRRFQSQELQNYFNSKSWYTGTIDPSDFDQSTLNDYEKKNAELLSKREFSMESGGYKLDVN